MVPLGAYVHIGETPSKLWIYDLKREKLLGKILTNHDVERRR
jgi:hypothetical protein